VVQVKVRSELSIRVLDWGGNGPPVVLLHPNGFCGGLYEPIAERIRPIARPIAIDLRGHGGSSAPSGSAAYRFEALAHDILDVLDHLGLHDVAGVGGSLGGAAAILVDRLDPGRWRRLLLAEPVAFPASAISEGDNPMSAAARRRRPRFDSRRAAVAAYRHKEPLAQLAPEALDAYVRWGTVADGTGVRLSCRPEIEAIVFDVSATPAGAADAWDHLPRLSCPTTIVSGQDSFLPDVFADQAELAGAKLVTVPGGHFVLHEHTARGAELISLYAVS
jgi:pimeloyl-ACP methyl ester carboxylesterase